MKRLWSLSVILFCLSFRSWGLDQDLFARCGRIYEVYSRCSDRVHVSEADFVLQLGGNAVEVSCTDGVARGFYDRVKNMDIASILSIPYPIGAAPLPYDDDPGRLRNEDLLKAVYGENKSAVARNLRRLKFLGNNVEFNRQNGAANALAAVGTEIEGLFSSDPEFAREMKAWTKGKGFRSISRGTFNWRLIAGTKQLSVHSFAVAIDLAPMASGLPEYWRWSSNLANVPEERVPNFKMPAKISTFPQKLVDTFERHGFIWGNKWRHFDSMHFEYRPEFFPDFVQTCEAP